MERTRMTGNTVLYGIRLSRYFRYPSNTLLAAMKIYEGANEEGEVAYFEVPNTFLSRKVVLKIVKSIPGVQNVTFKKGDVFCSFAVNGREFEAWEPFNDNSRFHVGEKEVCPSSELEVIKSHFKAYKSWPLSIFS